MLQPCGQQYGEGKCHITREHLGQLLFGVYFKLPALAWHAALHCDVHSLMSHPFPDNVRGLVLENPRKMWASLFLLLAEIWTSFWHKMSSISFPYSGGCSLAHNGGSMCCHQWQYDFMEVKSVVDDFMGRIVTNLQLVFHFINHQPSVVKNQCMNLFNVPFSCQCGKGQVTFIWPLSNCQFTHAQDIITSLCTPDIFSPQNPTKITHVSLLWCTW
jgi:hypothetical protein